MSKCDSKERTDCKSDDEINEFFKHENLLVLKNNIRFDQHKLGYESIVKESYIEWNHVAVSLQ